MTDALILAILVLCVVPDKQDDYVAKLSYAACLSMHNWTVGPLIDGFMYYYSAAVMCLITAFIVYNLKRSKSRLFFVYICLISATVNLGGWLLWLLYEPPLIYDMAFKGIFLAVVFYLIKGSLDRVGVFAVNLRIFGFFSSHSANSFLFNKNTAGKSQK